MYRGAIGLQLASLLLLAVPVRWLAALRHDRSRVDAADARHAGVRGVSRRVPSGGVCQQLSDVRRMSRAMAGAGPPDSGVADLHRRRLRTRHPGVVRVTMFGAAVRWGVLGALSLDLYLCVRLEQLLC